MQQPAMFGPVLSAGLSTRFEAEYFAQISRRKREMPNSETAPEGQSNGWHGQDQDDYSSNHPPNSSAAQSEPVNESRRGTTEANGLRESTHGKQKQNGWASADTLTGSHAST